MEHSKKYLMRNSLSVAAMIVIAISGTARAGDNERASREIRFAVLMDGPITSNDSGQLSADLYSIDGAKPIGRMLREGGCINFASDASAPPFLPTCQNPPPLSPGQFTMKEVW